MAINLQHIPTGCNKCNVTHRSNCENYNFNTYDYYKKF